jgi:hypothetical protein
MQLIDEFATPAELTGYARAALADRPENEQTLTGGSRTTPSTTCPTASPGAEAASLRPLCSVPTTRRLTSASGPVARA